MTPPNKMDNETAADTITFFRNQFTSSSCREFDLVHLNNAGQTPICQPALGTIEKWARRFYEEGAHVYPALVKEMTVARAEIAAFLGCHAEEIAFFQSAAGAISQVAFGFDFKPGDEIIVWEQEYPTNLYPWNEAARRSGARLVVAKTELDFSTPVATLARLITPRTRLIASSWVQFRTGAILDLEALNVLARPKGIFTCIDIIQGAGLLPFDFNASGIDAACGGSHKWMTGAHGAGFLALRQEHLERLTPLMFGAATITTQDYTADLSAQPRPDGQRFEPGGKAFLEILALASAAKLISQTGIARVAQEAEWLARNLVHGLREHGYLINSPHGPSHFRGAIVNFKPGPNSPLQSLSEIEKRLSDNRISFGLRPPGVRLSPHAFNSIEEIEKVLKILGK
jgi:selenocysteine lyase/cysteine desulfurase